MIIFYIIEIKGFQIILIPKFNLYTGNSINQTLLREELQKFPTGNLTTQTQLEKSQLVGWGALEGQVAIDPQLAKNFPQIETLSQAVPRLVTTVGSREIASGSAVCIHPSGLFISADHTTERYCLDIRDMLDQMGPYAGIYAKNCFDPKSYSMRSYLHANIPIIDNGRVGVHSVPLELLDYDSKLDISILRAMNLPFTTRSFTDVELSAKLPNAGDKTFKIGHTFGSVLNLVATGEVRGIYSREERGDINISSNGGHGDSGSGVFDSDGKLTTIVHTKSNVKNLIGATVAGQIEPYLKEVLGSDNLKRITDKAELKINKSELKRRTPMKKVAIEVPSWKPPLPTFTEVLEALQTLSSTVGQLGHTTVMELIRRIRNKH